MGDNDLDNLEDDALLAALGLPPSNLFRRDLNKMLMEDWNRVAYATMAMISSRSTVFAKAEAHAEMAMAAALRMLGLIGREVQVDDAKSQRQTSPQFREGLLVVEASEGFVDLSLTPGNWPMLVVPSRWIPILTESLEAAARANLFSAIVLEYTVELSPSVLGSVQRVTLPRRDSGRYSPAEIFQSAELTPIKRRRA